MISSRIKQRYANSEKSLFLFMAKVISFISRKGGTGKTTNAINLATALHKRGKKIILVETDTNYTLNTLRKMEQMQAEAGTAPTRGRFTHLPIRPFLGLRAEY